MRLFKKFGKSHERSPIREAGSGIDETRVPPPGEAYLPPPGPPPASASPTGSHQVERAYLPPLGPPPGYVVSGAVEESEGDQYGYPIEKKSKDGNSFNNIQGYTTAGPSSSSQMGGTSLPPSHTPPDYDAPPPSYLSLLPPPPPAHSYLFSPINNAPVEAAIAAVRFCEANPLHPPLHLPHPAQKEQLLTLLSQGGQVAMAQPQAHEKYVEVFSGGNSIIRITKRKSCPDTTIMSELPIYLANYHHPRIRRRERLAAAAGDSFASPFPAAAAAAVETVIVGYDLHILNLEASEDVVALGMACAPYPPFRLPGWNRGSFAVHSDDGRRYCNDDGGGVACLPPLRKGERYGLGFIVRLYPEGGYGDGKVVTEVVVLKGGMKAAGWMVKEEVERRREDPSIGLGGERDVYAAVGVAGGKSVEIGVRVWGEQEGRRVLERLEGIVGGY